jgi:hypothetical protein
MLELLLCSSLTILPDYLFRRYVQGKRFGHEITLFSVWFELRWGIVTCLMLTVGLITTVFYFHPATTSVTSFFRTVPIVPETFGRVAEIYVKGSAEVERGAPIFRLDDAKQKAAIETIRRRIIEIDAQMLLARSELAGAEGQLVQAQGAYRQAVSMRPCPQSKASKPASRTSFRRRRRVPKPPSPKPRWNWQRLWSAPASQVVSSNSRCRSAMLSIRWRAPQACSLRPHRTVRACRPVLVRSKGRS